MESGGSADRGHLPLCEWWACQGRQGHQGRQVGVQRAGRGYGTNRVHSACAGKGQKNPSLLTFSWVVPDSSVWSQDFILPASFSIPSSRSVGSTCWLLPAMSLSFQELRLSGSKRERGPHACHSRFPQRSMLLATSLLWPPLPALDGIRVLSPGASQTLVPLLHGAGLAGGMGRRAKVFMLLQAVSSVLVLRFRIPQEFP